MAGGRETGKREGAHAKGAEGAEAGCGLDGDWDIAAGQFLTSFRCDVHAVTGWPSGVTSSGVSPQFFPGKDGQKRAGLTPVLRGIKAGGPVGGARRRGGRAG